MTTRSEYHSDSSNARPGDASTPEPVDVVLAALAGKLEEAGWLATGVREALAGGDRLHALEAVVPAEQLLRDALALQTAAVVLHLEPTPRPAALHLCR